MEHDDCGGKRTRRRVLETAAASIAAGMLGANAGCLATLPPLGQRVKFGRVDAPEGADPTYTRWIPDAGALGEDTRLSASTDVMYTTPAQLRGTLLGRKGTFPARFLKSRVDYFGHGFDAYDVALGYGPVVALAGEVDRGLAGRTATDSGYARAGTYEGYDVYEREDVPRVAFVGDDVVAWARATAGSTARADVRAVLDARDGRIRRRGERDEAFATTVDETGTHPYTWVYETGPGAIGSAFPAATHVGVGTTTDGDGVYFVLTFRFDDGEVPSLGDAREALESNDRALSSEATDVSIGESIVRADVRMPVGEYEQQISAGVSEWPQVSWGASRDETAIRIRHEAGDPVGADWLTASLSPAVESPPTLFESGTVGPGDVATVDRTELPADTRNLRIEASPPESHSSGVVFSVPLDDGDA
jgi:hypothetical protein